jgi:hypothetical protein
VNTRVLPNIRTARTFIVVLFLFSAKVLLVSPLVASAQKQETVWSDQEKPIVDQLHGLRKLPDDVRSQTTKRLALQIRQLPATKNKVDLANNLADLSTEGDFGRDALQEVTTTLSDTLRAQPQPDEKSEPADPYMELAQLQDTSRCKFRWTPRLTRSQWQSSWPTTSADSMQISY